MTKLLLALAVVVAIPVSAMAADVEAPFIPYADNSDTFSNIWKLRAIRLFRG
jgi:hypothetical protein